MPVVESLFLLLHRDDGTPDSDMSVRFFAMVAGVVDDLVRARRIALSDHRDPRVTVVVPAPIGHPALDHALERLQRRDGRRLSSLMLDTHLWVEEQVAGALAARGVVGVEEKRWRGLVPARYPVLDPEPERVLRERLRAVLAGDVPGPEDAAVLAILQGVGVATKVLVREKGALGVSGLERRIEEIAALDPTAAAVARAAQAMYVNTAASSGG